MKKLFLLMVVVVMALGLTACGGDTAATNDSTPMVDVTSDSGISMKLPEDLVAQETPGAFSNMENGEGVMFLSAEVAGDSILTYNEASLLDMYKTKYPDAETISFEGGKKIDGKDGLISKIKLTTPKGNKVIMTVVYATDGAKNYVINFTHGADNVDTSLVKNLQACIDSIKIK